VASNLARDPATGTGVVGGEKFGRRSTDGGVNPNGLNEVGKGAWIPRLGSNGVLAFSEGDGREPRL